MKATSEFQVVVGRSRKSRARRMMKKSMLSAAASQATTNVAPDNFGDTCVRPYLHDLELAIQQLEARFCNSDSPSASPGSYLQDSTGAITSGMRDGSAHVLRCLKVWYDLPSEVFFTAVSSIDRFLAKMKAQPKHLSCIAVSAFHLACRQHQLYQQQMGLDEQSLISIPEPGDLVTISQSRCSSSDLLRMQAILVAKLECANAQEPPVTPLSVLRIMYAVSHAAAVRLGLERVLPDQLPDHLVHQLEILACDSTTLQHRPAEVVLALLASDFQRRAQQQPEFAAALMGFVAELQKCCGIAPMDFVRCLGVVVSQLDKYNGYGTVAHRQRLVWKLSNRTLRHLRPTDKLRATLPTIMEKSGSFRMRSSSECSYESTESLSDSEESEREMETEDAIEHELRWTASSAMPQ